MDQPLNSFIHLLDNDLGQLIGATSDNNGGTPGMVNSVYSLQAVLIVLVSGILINEINYNSADE